MKLFKSIAIVSIAILALFSILIIERVAFSQSERVVNGVNYLKSTQRIDDGSWGGSATSLNGVFPTTAAALEALRALEATTSTNQTNAIQFLTSQTVEENPFLAARIVALASTNTDTSADLNALLSGQNANGGWGTAEGFESDPLDTSQALLALKAANISNSTVLISALNYLAGSQNPDGGWALTPGEDSQVFYTALALQAINSCRLQFSLTLNQTRAITYLRGRQNADGGYGSPASTAFETAASLLAIVGSGQPLTAAETNAIGFLNSAQLSNGSWSDDAYSTALALRALTFPRDTDADGMPDDFETANGLNPNNPADATGDNDGDGLANAAEFRNSTNPNNSDTDGDGVDDLTEIANGSNPRDPASRNRPPVISSQPVTSASEGQVYSYQVQASDPDGDAPLSYSLLQSPAGMTISAAGLIGWTPGQSQSGGFTVIVRVSDGRGGTALQQYRLNVLAQGIDFTVASVDASQTATDTHTLVISGTVRAGIANRGGSPFTGGFTTLLFEDRNNNGTYQGNADNFLGTANFAGSIASNSVVQLGVRVSGVVQFRDNLIYAFVDSANQIPELSETNNIGSSGGESRYQPPVGDFRPKVKWTYGAPVSDIHAPPVVAPLVDTNGDQVINERDVPAVIMVADRVTALRGDTGAVIFSTEILGTNLTLSPAVGDLDGNGVPEIVVAGANNNLICVNNNGTLCWVSPGVTAASNLTLADLDGDRRTEILFGRSIFNFDGTVRRADRPTGVPSYIGGSQPIGASQVADLDLDGRPEIISGPAAFDRDGNAIWYWENPGAVELRGTLDRGETIVTIPNVPGFILNDSYTAVANLDDDPNPEIIAVCDLDSPLTGVIGNTLWAFEHDGRIKAGFPIAVIPPFPNQGNHALGAPAVADFDGDGEPEIAVPAAITVAGDLNPNNLSRTVLSVYERDGNLKWRRNLLNGGFVLPAAAFDFDGDGRSEITYQDEEKLTIADGSDGRTLYELGVGKRCCSGAGPVIADADNDGKPDIVMTKTTLPGGSRPGQGILVLGDAKGNWRNTRRLWNQWLYNNSRTQVPIENVNALAAPDLTVSRVTINAQNCPAGIGITARIGNGGSLHVAAGQTVNFYDGDPAAGGALIGSRLTLNALYPGESQDVTLTAAPTSSQVWVTVGDPPAETETVSNNLAILPHTWAQGSGYCRICQPASNLNAYSGIDGANNSGWAYSSTTTPTDPPFYKVNFQFPVNAASVTIQNGGLAGGFLTGMLDFSNGFSTPFSLNSNGEGTITFPQQRDISWARLTATTTRAAGPSLLEFIVAGSYTEPQFLIKEGAGRLGNNKASSGIDPGICNPAINQPPVIASAPPITAQPGVAYSYQAQVSDPNNDPLVFSLSSAPLGMTISTTGWIIWIPEAGQVGDAAVTMQVSDGRGGVASQSYTINVASLPGVNRPPQITSTPSGPVTLGQTYQYDVEAIDPDSDTILFSLLAPPAGATIDAFSGLITWTPNSSQVSSQPFIAIAEDGRGGRSVQSFAVEVRPSTDPLPPGPRDQDGDGFDESVDCNDANANINPSRNEILGNGLDDDCNPATPDVIPAGSVSCSIVSDKRGYKANSLAQLTVRAQNISSNLSMTGLDALVRVTDPGGQTVFTQTAPVNALAPNGRFRATVGFNTETRAPGNFQATLELRAGAATVCSSQATFAVVSSASQAVALSGSITATPTEIRQGNASTFNYTVSNVGNVDLPALILTILVVNTESGQVVRTLTDQTSLNRGQAFTGSRAFNSAGVSAGDYVIVLQGGIGGNNQTVASALLKVNGFAISGAVVRHAPKVFGRVEGSVQQLTGENVALNSGAVITGDLLVPGTPTLKTTGNPAFGGAVEGTGSAQPAGYEVALSGSAQLGRLVTRTDPISLPVVTAPPAAPGTRDVVLSKPGDSAGDFATVRDLALIGNVGLVAVPPGTYRKLNATGPNGFVFGVAGSTAPAVYNLEKLNLNTLESQLHIVGPVTINLANGLMLFGSMGNQGNPQWLVINVASGDVTLNSGSSLNGVVVAPASRFTIKESVVMKGSVFCDMLWISAGGVLRGM